MQSLLSSDPQVQRGRLKNNMNNYSVKCHDGCHEQRGEGPRDERRENDKRQEIGKVFQSSQPQVWTLRTGDPAPRRWGRAVNVLQAEGMGGREPGKHEAAMGMPWIHVLLSVWRHFVKKARTGIQKLKQEYNS